MFIASVASAAATAMFGSALALLLRVALVSVTSLVLTLGSGGLMDDERLLYATGNWHRLQRKRISFETSCYYTHEEELPHGCQYSTSTSKKWRDNTVRTTERAVLKDFYDGLGGDRWRTADNWNTGDPCWDAWYGVTCDEHGHVISIELVDNKLIGTIAKNVGDLTSLLKIDVSTTAPEYHNHVNKNLNRITGVVPSLAKISRLEELTLAGNGFTALPDDLYLNGESLRMICASYNLLTQMPKYLNRFKRLHTLELDHNFITGGLPPDLGYMLEARYIMLDSNRLSGPMPSTIAQLTRIRNFDVSHNPGLRDAISEDVIVNWVEVEYLAILNTSISGYISSLCLDVPFCWKHMFDTHKDLTWATAADVPDIVNITIELAKTNPKGA